MSMCYLGAWVLDFSASEACWGENLTVSRKPRWKNSIAEFTAVWTAPWNLLSSLSPPPSLISFYPSIAPPSHRSYAPPLSLVCFLTNSIPTPSLLCPLCRSCEYYNITSSLLYPEMLHSLFMHHHQIWTRPIWPHTKDFNWGDYGQCSYSYVLQNLSGFTLLGWLK